MGGVAWEVWHGRCGMAGLDLFSRPLQLLLIFRNRSSCGLTQVLGF